MPSKIIFSQILNQKGLSIAVVSSYGTIVLLDETCRAQAFLLAVQPFIVSAIIYRNNNSNSRSVRHMVSYYAKVMETNTKYRLGIENTS